MSPPSPPTPDGNVGGGRNGHPRAAVPFSLFTAATERATAAIVATTRIIIAFSRAGGRADARARARPRSANGFASETVE